MKAEYKNKRSAIIVGEKDHMLSILDNMRQADQDEVRAASGLEPDLGLLDSWCRSMKTWAMISSGEIAAVMGLVAHPQSKDTGIPWMLGSDLMDSIKLFFTKQSKDFIRNEMLSEFKHLTNYVDVRNIKSIKWLVYCGFQLSKPAPFGPEGKAFHKMYLNKSLLEESICATRR